MTDTHEQHPAAAYYAAPDGTVADRPKDLTALGVLAFATAAAATAGTCVAAVVLGRAMRIKVDNGQDASDWSLGVYYAGTGLALVAMVAGFVVGSLWLHRARRNAELLSPGSRHARRPGWAWGGWVTPVVALWFPFQVVRDVRRAVSPLPSAALIGFWWTLFLASEIGWRTSFNLQGDALNGSATRPRRTPRRSSPQRSWSPPWPAGARCCEPSPSSSTNGCTPRPIRSRTSPSAHHRQNITVEKRQLSPKPTRS